MVDVWCNDFLSILNFMTSYIDYKRSLLGKRFISLKWKAALVISVIVLLVHSFYFYYHYSKLHFQFKKEIIESRYASSAMLHSIIDQELVELQRIASSVPSLYGFKGGLDKNKWSELEQQLSRSWSGIQVEYGLDGVMFFNGGQRLVLETENNGLFTIDRENLNIRVKEVSKSSYPVSYIDCSNACMKVALVPYLSSGSDIKIIVVYSSIADIILKLADLSGVDVGVIRQRKSTSTRDRIIPLWEMEVIAFTNISKMTSLLNSLSNKYSDTASLINDSPVAWEDGTYDINMLEMSTVGGVDNGYIVIVNNATRKLNEVSSIAIDSLLISIVGFIALDMGLLMFLWKPLSRLKTTALTLPMLARSEYDSARELLMREKESDGRHIDEIDLVNNSAVELSLQLEILNREVGRYTKSLAFNMGQLKEERDFTTFLFNSAQVIILTLSREGRILRVNDYGLDMCGANSEQVLGKTFESVFASESERVSSTETLKRVCESELKHFCCEGSFITTSGSIKSIAWAHSFIQSDQEQAASILSVGTDITERKESERRIAWLANHDALTGLYNRRYFNEVFDNYLKRSIRYNISGALLFLDLDNFKYVNDTMGHQEGDRLIKEVARALTRIVRNADIIARIGGDEFAIVIQDIDKQGVMDFCKDLNRRLNSVISPIAGKKGNTSTSIGIAMFPLHGETVQELLANADIAMYQAKDRGKARWHMFSEHEQARKKLERHITLKEKIEKALKNDQFILYFQPIMLIKDNRITHYEVLLRVIGDNGEILEPAPFIEVAESTGLINEIDRMVLRKTLEIMRIDQTLYPDRRFSVNLSAHTFSNRKNFDDIKEIIRNGGVDANKLMFEITETAALQELSTVCEIIRELQDMGCSLAIDDFGVGFSSFYYLRELPVDYVKIDGSFIQQMANNPDDRLIVKAMAEIVRGFGKRTIAEYVEDKDTFQILKDLGVDYAQGFFVGSPEGEIDALPAVAEAEA